MEESDCGTAMRASDLVGLRIREIRDRRGWTARQLAERCAEIGAPGITTAVIANIETGRRDKDGQRRREVTAEELLTLAYALEVPPVLLMSPFSKHEALEIAPGIEKDALEAAAWIADDDAVLGPVRIAASSRSEDTERILRWRGSALTVVRQIRVVARAIKHRDFELTDEKFRARWPNLVEHNAEILVTLSIRLLHLLDALRTLDYEPPELADVMEILRRIHLPTTLGEWEQQVMETEMDDEDGLTEALAAAEEGVPGAGMP